jgi:ABC-2 type transport system ATP-binding protein
VAIDACPPVVTLEEMGQPAIAVHRLSKRFGNVLAVDDLSFEVQAGTVTGFLGPNGAGKTTTLRMLLGLVTPTAGEATIGGVPYCELSKPLRHVGAMLEASGVHPGRRAVDHLRIIATAAGLPARRAEEVLGHVGLSDVAGRRVGGFSLGMRQRLALAGALLGDPGVLVLDEPANGLDPEGMHWLRKLMRRLADEGRTVLVSSHVLAEVAQTVDDVVIVARGRLVTHAPLAALTGRTGTVRLRSPQAAELVDLLTARGIDAHLNDAGQVVALASADAVGRAAAEGRIVLHEMHSDGANLEETFLMLTGTVHETDRS